MYMAPPRREHPYADLFNIGSTEWSCRSSAAKGAFLPARPVVDQFRKSRKEKESVRISLRNN